MHNMKIKLIYLTGHKYYGVKRRRLFVDSINSIIYDDNYGNYRDKILTQLHELYS